MYSMFMKEEFVRTDPNLRNSERLNLVTKKWASQSAAQKARYRGLAVAANDAEGDVGTVAFAEWLGSEPQTKSDARQRSLKQQAIEKTMSDMRADSVWKSGCGVFGFDGPMVR